MKPSNTRLISSSIWLMLALILSSNASSSNFFHWVDKNGEAHYSYTLPPVMSQDGYTKLNETGRHIKTVSAVENEPKAETPKQEKATLTDEELRQQQANEKHDNYLISAYLNVDELVAAHEKRQKLLTDQIKLYNTRITKLEKALDKASKQEKSAQNKNSKRKFTEYIEITNDSINIYKEMIVENTDNLKKNIQNHIADKERLSTLLSEDKIKTQEK